MEQTYTNEFYSDFFSHLPASLVEQEALKIKQDFDASVDISDGYTCRNEISIFFKKLRQSVFEKAGLRYDSMFDRIFGQQLVMSDNPLNVVLLMIEETACLIVKGKVKEEAA